MVPQRTACRWTVSVGARLSIPPPPHPFLRPRVPHPFALMLGSLPTVPQPRGPRCSDLHQVKLSRCSVSGWRRKDNNKRTHFCPAAAHKLWL